MSEKQYVVIGEYGSAQTGLLTFDTAVQFILNLPYIKSQGMTRDDYLNRTGTINDSGLCIAEVIFVAGNRKQKDP